MTFLDALRPGEPDARPAFTWLPTSGAPVTLSRTELDAHARGLGGALRSAFPLGTRALLICPAGPSYVRGFLGCLYAGVVAVPAYPPERGRTDRTGARLRALARDAEPALVLTSSEGLGQREAVASLAPELARLPWWSVETEADPAAWRRPPIDASSVAFLQYTSGSTGDPRGVRVTQGNLLANSRQIAATREDLPEPVGVSWLPPYHDMGLIGGILQPLYARFPSVGMAPDTFLRSPVRWLQAIGTWHATGTAAPNFALDLCCRRVRPEDHPELDLASLRHLYIGAEKVRAETLDRFVAAFAPVGLREDCLRPSYGLAEATLMVSGRHTGPRPARGPDGVSCGAPVCDVAVLPVAGHAGGEIWVRGDNVADGYHRGDPDGRFDARLDGGRWLRTGDLGRLVDGELYVTGRLSDVIAWRGRNLHPQDLEATAEAAHRGVRAGRVAAFEVDDRLVIVAEVARDADPGAVGAAVCAAAAAEHGAPPDRVVCVEPHGVPRTSSGKVRRRPCRDALLAGTLPVRGEAAPRAPDAPLYPALDASAGPLDRRPLGYQFDLDADVDWSAVDAPGEHVPAGLVAFSWAEALPLQADPAAWQLFQWVAGLALCDVIIRLEEGLVRFLRVESRSLGDRRSLGLLAEEEEKHMALFRRYADHLRARRPELLPVYDAALEAAWVPLPFDHADRDDDPAAFHYQAWLQALFFEEWTIWFHDRLVAERASAQPTWLGAHRAHAREEAQHVRTGSAWLDALAVPEATRRDVARARLAEVMRPLQVSNHVIRAVCAHAIPEHAGALARPNPSAPLLALLRERALARTRRHAPFFAETADRALPGSAEAATVRRRPSIAEAERWIAAWIAGIHPGRRIDPDATFAEAGLDSADTLGLSGEIEAWLGGVLSPTIAYEFPTPRLLAGWLASLSEAPARAVPRAASTLTRRQHRWLGLAEAGLRHNVTEVYRTPGTTPEAIASGLERLADAHPALRRRFIRGPAEWRPTDGPGPIVEVHASDLPLHDALREVARVASDGPFVEGAPLLRVHRVEAAGEAGLVLSAPHVAADGAAMARIARDLHALVSDPDLRLAPTLDPWTLAEEEAAWLETPAARDRIGWWRARLADLPRDAPRAGFDGRRRVRVLSAEDTRRVAARAEALRVSPLVLHLAALSLAHRRARGARPVIGTQLAGRSTAERGRIFGYLVDVAIVRATDAEATLDATVASVAPAWLETLQHFVTVDAIVEAHFPERLRERWLPAPLSFNLIRGSAERIGSAPARWERLPGLLPETRSFLFYEEMLLAQPMPDGGTVVVSWHPSGRAEEAAALLDTFVDVLVEGG